MTQDSGRFLSTAPLFYFLFSAAERLPPYWGLESSAGEQESRRRKKATGELDCLGPRVSVSTDRLTFWRAFDLTSPRSSWLDALKS